MISGQWFYRFLKNWPKITYNSMISRGSTPIITNLVGVHPRNIHTKFEANPCSGLRVEVKKLKKFMPTSTKADTGWLLESHSLSVTKNLFMGMLTLSGAPSTTSHFGYLHLVQFSLFGKSSWLMHVDFWPHEELIANWKLIDFDIKSFKIINVIEQYWFWKNKPLARLIQMSSHRQVLILSRSCKSNLYAWKLIKIH